MAVVSAVVFAALLPSTMSLEVGRRLENACEFDNEPEIPYYWDPTCPEDGTSLGCLADGKNHQCRFCGVGDYASVFCPAKWCQFDNQPHLPYYWDSSCTMGQLGCLADGHNIQCRYCGEFPYDSIPCKDEYHAIVPTDTCDFDNEPTTPYFWDATCYDGMVGCKADNKHVGCRFCGEGEYASIDCPPSLCTFTPNQNEPAHPYKYYWDPKCWTTGQVLGCKADGIHPFCRFCGGGEYESIPCPVKSASFGGDL